MSTTTYSQAEIAFRLRIPKYVVTILVGRGELALTVDGRITAEEFDRFVVASTTPTAADHRRVTGVTWGGAA